MAGDGGRVPDVSERRADSESPYSETYVRRLRDQRDDWRRIAQTLGYREAGAEWLEPWCDEHPDGDGQGCVACIGASHDAWMHRAKDAEARLAEQGASSGPASVLAALLAESPEATVAAIEALLTSETPLRAAAHVMYEAPPDLDVARVWDVAVSAACRSLLPKAPKEDGDA